MKQITVEDCVNLEEQFDAYCETAEQREFPMLFMVEQRLKLTVQHIQSVGKVENQHDIRAMFRVVLNMIGKDFSEYVEE